MSCHKKNPIGIAVSMFYGYIQLQTDRQTEQIQIYMLWNIHHIKTQEKCSNYIGFIPNFSLHVQQFWQFNNYMKFSFVFLNLTCYLNIQINFYWTSNYLNL